MFEIDHQGSGNNGSLWVGMFGFTPVCLKNCNIRRKRLRFIPVMAKLSQLSVITNSPLPHTCHKFANTDLYQAVKNDGSAGETEERGKREKRDLFTSYFISV